MSRSILLAAFAAGFTLSSAWAQIPPLQQPQPLPPGIEHAGVQDGLASDFVNSLLVDSRGFLWAGTSEGLSRYDGIEFRTYRADSKDPLGLPADYVSHLSEDRSGRIWVSIAPARLCRLDVFVDEFTCFSLRVPDDSLRPAGFLIYQSIPDRKNDDVIWAATSRGLARLDVSTGEVIRYPLPTTLVDPTLCDTLATPNGCSRMRCLVQDREGAIWVGVRGSGLARFDPASGTVAAFPGVMEDLFPRRAKAVLDIIQPDSSAGTVLVSVTGGIRAVDRMSERVRRVEIPADDDGDWTYVLQSLEDAERRLWFGTLGGLARLSDDGTRLDPVLQMPPVRALAEDPGGQIWIGTGGEGLYRMAPDRVEAVTKRVRYGGTRSFAELDGLLLLGAWEHVAGLTQDREEALRVQIPGVMPTHIHVDQGGDVWVATQDAGLLRLQTDVRLSSLADTSGDGPATLSVPESLLRCTQDPDLPDGISVHEHALEFADGSSAGRVVHMVSAEWFYSWSWVNSLSLARLKGAWSHPDEPDVLWLVHENGLARIDRRTNGVEVVLALDQVFQTADLYGLARDGRGRMWLAAGLGLFILDESRSSTARFPLHFEGTEPPTGVDVLQLEVDPNDASVLWLGTRKGLARVDLDSARVEWIREPGFRDRAREIVTMAFDPEGRLWTGSRYNQAKSGLDLARYDPTSGSWLRFRHSYAFERIFVDSEGRLLLGALGGFFEVRPELLVQDSVPPAISVLSAGPPAVPRTGHNTDPVRRPLWDGSQVRITPGERDIRFDYVGLSWRDPAHVRYAYMLDGYDQDWIDAGAERFARYTNLAPGEYTFRLRAVNAEGVWTPEPLEVPVVVLPPWFRTPWVYAVYVLLLVAGLVLAERLRHATIVRRERQQASVREAEIRSEVAEEKAHQASEHAERMEQLNSARSRFLANVSHEFRTPLTLILGLAEDAERGRYGPVSGPLRRTHETILRNARQVDSLVRQLLDLSRLESGTLTLRLRPADLSEIVSDVSRAHTPLAERRGVSLRHLNSPDSVQALCDPEKVATALGNVIANAIKFTGRGGDVSITLHVDHRDEGTAAMIVVRDTGIGIAPRDLARIFDRFEQVGTPSGPPAEGLGIGLSLTKDLVELHGGSVSVQSEVGTGSTFTIELPVVMPEPGDKAPPKRSEAAYVTVSQSDLADTAMATTGLTRGDGIADAPLVLVVDDNDDVRAFLRDHFEPAFQVAEARDGVEGLEQAQALRPDIVVADVMMPRMDGIDLCRSIRSEPGLKTVPVVLLTARAGEENALEGLEAGADEYVTKPFSVALLVQLAENLVRSRSAVRQEAERRMVVDESGLGSESHDAWLRRRVMEVAGEHLGDLTFTLEALADEVGLSLRQLERKLPDVCGETPSEMIRRMRLERASHLLKADIGTVQEIARAAGYRSPSHFSVAFRRRYGTSPSAYRKDFSGR